MDFLYRMKSTDPSPVGDGNMENWFRYYKMGREDDVYIPVPPDHAAAAVGEPGDTMWFLMDNLVVAVAPISRVQEDVFNKRYEVWYDGTKMRAVPFIVCAVEPNTQTIDQELACVWTSLALDKNA